MNKKKPKDAADKLLIAAGNWAKSVGGHVKVAGPISMIKLPDSPPGVYYIGIYCLGKEPTNERK